MDSKDDFQFRPLTKGLGFHKKNPAAPSSNEQFSQGHTPLQSQAPSQSHVSTQKISPRATTETSRSAQTVSRLLNSMPTTEFVEKANAEKAQAPLPQQIRRTQVHQVLWRAIQFRIWPVSQ